VDATAGTDNAGSQLQSATIWKRCREDQAADVTASLPEDGSVVYFGGLVRRMARLRVPAAVQRMGQSCLHRASPSRPFTETSTTRRVEDDNESRPRLTGYMALPRSDTTAV